MVVANLTATKGRVDFSPNGFDKTIRDHGLLAYWSRAIHCPCRSNAQTDQADPTCASCGGDGYLYVKPREAPALQDHVNAGHVDTDDAKASQVLVQSITRDPQIFEKLGEWIFGTVRLSTFSWHRFDYRDRFVLKGACMKYQQSIPVPAGGAVVVGPRYAERDLRYPVVELLEAYTNTDPTTGPVSVYEQIACDVDGGLLIDTAIPAGTLVSLTYAFNPILIVMDHVYAVRDSPIASPGAGILGREVALPRHAMGRLDFLVSP
jgi:hypothetical protein